MRRKIPSTMSLIVFEAAARHGSFSRAADELFLTESAVSRQIASLEAFLGLRLFERTKKQVVLNDAGRSYINDIGRHLADIEMHTLALMAHKGAAQVLNLAVIPTFANRWLLPRLQEFRKRHPDITLNLSERPNPFIFSDSNFDAALHFDHPAWAGMTRIGLFEEELVPVVNPRYFDLATPAALLDVPLIHKSTRLEAWQRWFELAGVPDAALGAGMHFELYGMVIEAARAGLGAGLVPVFYVQDEIRRNELVIPFDTVLMHQKRYCLIYPDYKQASPAVCAFRDWVVDAERAFTHARLGPPLPADRRHASAPAQLSR